MAARETRLRTGRGKDKEEDIDDLKKDIREAEVELAQTIRQIKDRVSYQALKDRAFAEVREVAVEKPKRVASSVAKNGYAYLRKAERGAREYPIIPLIAGIVIITPLMLGRILRRKR